MILPGGNRFVPASRSMNPVYENSSIYSYMLTMLFDNLILKMSKKGVSVVRNLESEHWEVFYLLGGKLSTG